MFNNKVVKPIDKQVVVEPKGVCTLWWPYVDVTMVVFPIFLKYKKINKIKFIEIIKKRDSLI